MMAGIEWEGQEKRYLNQLLEQGYRNRKGGIKLFFGGCEGGGKTQKRGTTKEKNSCCEETFVM